MRLARRRGGGNGVFRLSLPLPLCIFRIFAWQEHDERMNKSKQTQENTASGEPSYITGYVRYLWLEEGLSDNTRKAYREDLQRFLDFAAERGIDVLKADLAVFHDFVYALHSMGISARSILESKFMELKEKFKNGEIPLPSFWGGYRVTFDTVEFWQGRENRLHDRFFYQKDADGNWQDPVRLAP